MMTEVEAKTKWCPHVRMTADSAEWHTNRGDYPNGVGAHNCIGDRCMAWRWNRSKRPVRPRTVNADVWRAILENRMIDAIRIYRSLHSADLKTSKDYCCALRDRIPQKAQNGFCGLAGAP